MNCQYSCAVVLVRIVFVSLNLSRCLACLDDGACALLHAPLSRADLKALTNFDWSPSDAVDESVSVEAPASFQKAIVRLEAIRLSEFDNEGVSPSLQDTRPPRLVTSSTSAWSFSQPGWARTCMSSLCKASHIVLIHHMQFDSCQFVLMSALSSFVQYTGSEHMHCFHILHGLALFIFFLCQQTGGSMTGIQSVSHKEPQELTRPKRAPTARP